MIPPKYRTNQGRCPKSGQKEHFTGLLKEIGRENARIYGEVEKRDLSVYDRDGGE